MKSNNDIPDGLIDTSTFDYYVIVDLESTCCDKGTIPNNEGEIIEIGAVVAKGESLSYLASFTTFVKPIKVPTLTPFCTKLTSITQQDVDSAPRFSEAASLFEQWLSKYPNHLFCSWGNYDKNHLNSESLLYKIPCPIQAPHINLKRYLARYQKVKRMGLQNALLHYNFSFDGICHRGVDDAKNALKLLPYCLGRQ